MSDTHASRKADYGHAAGISRTVLVCTAIVAFTIGMVAGFKIQKHKISKQLDENVVGETITTANTNPDLENDTSARPCLAESCGSEQTQPKESENTTVKSDTFYILGKVFSDAKSAYSKGLTLKKAGLPVFLSKNGEKMKLYIGPIQGENQAYLMLSKIKKVPDFKGAILHRQSAAGN